METKLNKVCLPVQQKASLWWDLILSREREFICQALSKEKGGRAQDCLLMAGKTGYFKAFEQCQVWDGSGCDELWLVEGWGHSGSLFPVWAETSNGALHFWLSFPFLELAFGSLALNILLPGQGKHWADSDEESVGLTYLGCSTHRSCKISQPNNLWLLCQRGYLRNRQHGLFN